MLTKKKKNICMVCIALLTVSVSVHAQQIAPNPNPVGSTITVSTPDAVNDIFFWNSGALEITSAGTLSNNAALFNDSGSRINNAGTLINYGSISSDMGVFNNSGSINNYGEIGGYGELFNSGMLNNSGRIGIGDFNLANAGTFINSGDVYLDIVFGGSGLVINTGSLYVQNGRIDTYHANQVINNGSMGAMVESRLGNVSGTGTFDGIFWGIPGITLSGSVNPGNPFGSTLGTLTFNVWDVVAPEPDGLPGLASYSNYLFEIGGVDVGQYDVVKINGRAGFYDGVMQFEFVNGFSAAVGNYWDFLLADSTIAGWDNLSFNMPGYVTGWEIIDIANGGKRLLITAVPEPNTLILLGSGVIGLLAGRKMFRRWDR